MSGIEWKDGAIESTASMGPWFARATSGDWGVWLDGVGKIRGGMRADRVANKTAVAAALAELRVSSAAAPASAVVGWRRCPDCDENGRTYAADDSRIDCPRCGGGGRLAVETPSLDGASCFDSAIAVLREEHAKVSKSLASSGDRRDWDGSNRDAQTLENIESMIARLERARAAR